MSSQPPISFENTAERLAHVWLNIRITELQARAQADDLIALPTPEQDRPQLRALSLAFEALRRAVFRPDGDTEARQATEAQLHRVRAMGWSRATELAEAAWAWVRVFDRHCAQQALALLQAQPRQHEIDPARTAQKPALERVWAASALSVLYCLNADHDQALLCGLRAEAWAHQADHDGTRLQVAQNLAFLYLSVGDLEAADAVLTVGLAARQRCGHQGLGLVVNRLLALVLSRHFDQAAQLVQDEPELGQEPIQATWPFVKALVARVRLSQGRLDEAADLPAPGGAPQGTEPHTAAANRLWVCADVLVGLGRFDEARQLLQVGLQAFADASLTLLPMNATQLYRALADACEAAGDLPAALAALRQSQAHCFSWVEQSMRARLQALHFSAAPHQSDERRLLQDQRLIQVERALIAAREDAQSLQADLQDRHKLLAEVTHEVRNPLHGVVWMTSLLIMSDLDDRQREFLNLANSSARMALSLCNDVLDLARMEAGKLRLKAEPLRLDELVAECARLYAAPAGAKGVELSWQCDPALPSQVRGDRLRLQQVLMNLLGNATKFTQAGRIDVAVNWLGEQTAPAAPTVHLSVADTGQGLPEGLMPRLFHEFEQAATPTEAQGAGAGLGLALCRQFVHLMGGEIGVRNRPGQGCTFWCLLPLRAA